jgi:hypothetical protein
MRIFTTIVVPKCLRSMRIIAFIEDEQLVKKVLKSAVGGCGMSSENRLLVRMWYIRLWRSPLPETYL